MNNKNNQRSWEEHMFDWIGVNRIRRELSAAEWSLEGPQEKEMANYLISCHGWQQSTICICKIVVGEKLQVFILLAAALARQLLLHCGQCHQVSFL